ncbi:MAG: DUF2029 domain-containing protein [Bacteroidia bacterium]|nr:DUF2029 domain-containing protein [Bacteroidia bacterium]
MSSPGTSNSSFKPQISALMVVMGLSTVVAGLATTWLMFKGKQNINLTILLFLSTFIVYTYRARISKRLHKSLYWGFLWGAAISILFVAGNIVYENNNTHKQWDFPCFYLDAQVYHSGLNMYDPESYSHTFNEISFPEDLVIGESFHEQVVDMGFKYFPPAVNYFVPMAGLSFEHAQLLWTIMNCIALLGVILLVYRIFFFGIRLEGFLYSLIFVAGFRPVLSTLSMEQFHLWGLCWVLLAWLQLKKPLAGLWLSLASFTKPQLIILGGHMLSQLSLRQLAIYALTTVGLFIFTFSHLGFDMFFPFIESFQNAGEGLPPSVYTEGINKSLLANLLRISNFDFSYNPIFYWPFLIIGGAIGILSFIACWILRNKDPYLGYSILIVMSLIVYPGTLFPYGVYILPVLICLLLNNPLDEKKSFIWLIGLIALICIHIKFQFWSLIILWLGLMLVAFASNTSLVSIPFFKHGTQATTLNL